MVVVAEMKPCRCYASIGKRYKRRKEHGAHNENTWNICLDAASEVSQNFLPEIFPSNLK